MNLTLSLCLPIALAVGLAGLFSLLLAVLFWYENLNQPCPPLFAVLRAHPLRCAVLGFFSSLASQLAVAAVFPLGFVASLWRPGPGARRDKPAVVLLHGLYHNPSAWLFLRRRLRKAGYERLFAPGYDSLCRDRFEDIAGRLARQVKEIIAANGPIALIGHSQGGLFVRALLADPEIAAATLGAATLGAPHRGSKLAVLAIGGLGRDLAYDGPLSGRLGALSPPTGPPLLGLASPMDNMVLPLSALIENAPGWTFEAVAPVSHLAMLLSASVADRLLAFLNALKPSRGQTCCGGTPCAPTS